MRECNYALLTLRGITELGKRQLIRVGRTVKLIEQRNNDLLVESFCDHNVRQHLVLDKDVVYMR